MFPRASSILALTALVGCATLRAQEPLPYKTIGETTLHLHVYKPEGWKPSDLRPAIVFFFGGGWSSGTPRQFDPHCRHLAEKGLVAFSAEYRIRSVHGSTPFESTMDAKSAVRWIRAHAAELGVDPDRLAAGGGSAGGHLAAATATVGAKVNDPQDDPAIRATPDALVLFNPALVLTPERAAKPWGDAVAARIEEISPLHQLQAKLPPTIVFHGTGDTTVPFATVAAFASRAADLGLGSVQVEAYEGRPHGFFNHGRGDGTDYADTIAKLDGFLVQLGWIKAGG